MFNTSSNKLINTEKKFKISLSDLPNTMKIKFKQILKKQFNLKCVTTNIIMANYNIVQKNS